MGVGHGPHALSRRHAPPTAGFDEFCQLVTSSRVAGAIVDAAEEPRTDADQPRRDVTVERDIPFDGAVQSRFRRRVVTIAPGSARPYHEDEWRDAVVLIGRGRVDFVCDAGGTRSFGQGDVVYMVGLPLRTLRNAGVEPVVLVAISRETNEASSDLDGVS